MMQISILAVAGTVSERKFGKLSGPALPMAVIVFS